jgi:hypothetical protein
MATSLVNVNLLVTDNSKAARAGLPVILYQPYDAPQTVVQSGTSDSGGRFLFSGVSAGVYDIGVVYNSGTALLRNYYVKNEYVVDPSNVFEARSYVQSEQMSDLYMSGTRTQNVNIPVGTLSGTIGLISRWNGNYLDRTIVDGNGVTGPSFQNAIDWTMINTSGLLYKSFDNSYNRLNASTYFSQNVTMKVS